MILRPLTAELDSKDSPVRQFLDDRFTSGLRDVQRRYRQAAPPLVVPSADRQEANPGTVGTAENDVLTNPNAPSGPDWGNVKNALAGKAALPSDGWVFGPGYTKGLSTADVAAELKAPQSTATLDSWESTVLSPLTAIPDYIAGKAASAAGSAAEGALGALLPSIGAIALKLTLTLGAAALVVIGLELTTGAGKDARDLMPAAPPPSELAADAPELAAA